MQDKRGNARNRIASQVGLQTHFATITYLNNLSTQWKLRAAGEPHELTLELIGQWQTHRNSVLECSASGFTRAPLNILDAPTKLPMHGSVVKFIDDLITKLEAEYEWPAPLQPLVKDRDIEQLRQYAKALENCREGYIKY